MSGDVWFRIFQAWFVLSVAAFAFLIVRGELAHRGRRRADSEVERGIAYLRDHRKPNDPRHDVGGRT